MADLDRTVQQNKDKGKAPFSLLIFGNEDAGPSAIMARRMERLADPQGLLQHAAPAFVTLFSYSFFPGFDLNLSWFR